MNCRSDDCIDYNRWTDYRSTH